MGTMRDSLLMTHGNLMAQIENFDRLSGGLGGALLWAPHNLPRDCVPGWMPQDYARIIWIGHAMQLFISAIGVYPDPQAQPRPEDDLYVTVMAVGERLDALTGDDCARIQYQMPFAAQFAMAQDVAREIVGLGTRLDVDAGVKSGMLSIPRLGIYGTLPEPSKA